MIRQTERLAALRELIPIPPHVHALAAAISYDLRHGPAWARIPAEGIGAFTVDDFASDQESLEDDQADAIEREDAADGEGEGHWEDNEGAYELDASDVITALFGRTLAREFPL